MFYEEKLKVKVLINLIYVQQKIYWKILEEMKKISTKKINKLVNLLNFKDIQFICWCLYKTDEFYNFNKIQ